MMLNHLWYENDEMDAQLRQRAWARPTTRQPVPRRGGARRAVGRALIGLGELIASNPSGSTAAGK